MSPAPLSWRQRYGAWAVIAGASEGLGAAFARALAARGHDLVLVARREPLLAQLASELAAAHHVEARPLALDLADPATVPAIALATRELEVGVLVYNAALSPIAPFLEVPLEEHLRVLEINCRAPTLLTRALGEPMRARGRGAILLMSSMMALQGSVLISHYAATRAFNLVLAEGLWSELREAGVDVLACCPGATRTPSYFGSQPRRGRFAAPEQEPEAVVAEALAALGRGPSTVTGRFNRVVALLQRLLPRRTAVELMSRTVRQMYER